MDLGYCDCSADVCPTYSEYPRCLFAPAYPVVSANTIQKRQPKHQVSCWWNGMSRNRS